MGLILFILIPLGWAVTGRLLGAAVARTVTTAAGQRLGYTLGRWCMWIFPAIFYLLFFLGVSGDAGHGVRIFGSEELLGVMCLSIYTAPALALYLVAVYVVRDIVRGLRSRG